MLTTTRDAARKVYDRHLKRIQSPAASMKCWDSVPDAGVEEEDGELVGVARQQGTFHYQSAPEVVTLKIGCQVSLNANIPNTHLKNGMRGKVCRLVGEKEVPHARMGLHTWILMLRCGGLGAQQYP